MSRPRCRWGGIERWIVCTGRGSACPCPPSRVAPTPCLAAAGGASERSCRTAMRQVHGRRAAPYLGFMTSTPAFLDSNRPDVPDIVVPRGVTPFHLPRRPVRGRLVRLGPLADALLTRHQNHPAVTQLAGQALALAAALASALKFRGSFSLQAKGDGAVPMLLAGSCGSP